MRCKKIQGKFPDYLTGELDAESREEIQSHITDCAPCRKELEELNATWSKLGVLPSIEPSKEMRTRFYAMLETYKKETEHEKPAYREKGAFSEWLESWWPRRPVFQFSAALLLLFFGLVGGFFIQSSRQQAKDVARLNQELQSMRQMVAVSLLNQPSPSDRLKGVTWSYELEKPDQATLQALLDTLNNDSNVNVRLAAVDALYLFHDYPVVKDGLVQSLSRQNSPLVQVSLIDLLVGMRERRAVNALKQLVQDEQLNPDVKQRAEQGIERLSF